MNCFFRWKEIEEYRYIQLHSLLWTLDGLGDIVHVGNRQEGREMLNEVAMAGSACRQRPSMVYMVSPRIPAYDYVINMLYHLFTDPWNIYCRLPPRQTNYQYYNKQTGRGWPRRKSRRGIENKQSIFLTFKHWKFWKFVQKVPKFNFSWICSSNHGFVLTGSVYSLRMFNVTIKRSHLWRLYVITCECMLFSVDRIYLGNHDEQCSLHHKVSFQHLELKRARSRWQADDNYDY